MHCDSVLWSFLVLLCWAIETLSALHMLRSDQYRAMCDIDNRTKNCVEVYGYEYDSLAERLDGAFRNGNVKPSAE